MRKPTRWSRDIFHTLTFATAENLVHQGSALQTAYVHKQTGQAFKILARLMCAAPSAEATDKVLAPFPNLMGSNTFIACEWPLSIAGLAFRTSKYCLR